MKKKIIVAIISLITIAIGINFIYKNNVFLNAATNSVENNDVIIQGVEGTELLQVKNITVGTDINNLELPDVFRVVIEIDYSIKKYTKQNVDEDVAQWGYLYDENLSLYYLLNEDGKKDYRTYGTMNEESIPGWYVANEQSEVLKKIIEVPITWNLSKIKTNKQQEVKIVATAPKKYVLGEIEPYARINITDPSTEEDEHTDHDAEGYEKGNQELLNRKIEADNRIEKAMNNEELMAAALKNNTATNIATLQNMYPSTTGDPNTYTTPKSSIDVPYSWYSYVNTIWNYRTGLSSGESQLKWNDQLLGYKQWRWSGDIAKETTGTVTTNPKRIPVKNASNEWLVYSGEQLRYALENFLSGDTVSLGSNIDMNGRLNNWSPILVGNKQLTLNGNKFKIYNLAVFIPKNATGSILHASFLTYFTHTSPSTIKDLTFENANFVNSITATDSGTNLSTTSLFSHTLLTSGLNINNVFVKSSLFYSLGEGVAPIGTRLYQTTYQNCGVEDNFVYGRDHVTGFTVWGGGGVTIDRGDIVKNSYSVNTLIATYGGHSAMFHSCGTSNNLVENSFANNEMYATAIVGGFAAEENGKFLNSFATGKLEGFYKLGGFYSTYGPTTASAIENCYTSVLVGLRSEATLLGGFSYSYPNFTNGGRLTNNYAAGEVGDFTTPVNNGSNIEVGGFVAQHATNYWKGGYSNNFYDKQTTAMREWTTGTNKDIIPGITGLLTSDTKDSDGVVVAGLASGKNIGLPANLWHYEKMYNPQLKSFINANISTWGSPETVELVKANSKASASTVLLDTWESGYQWKAKGARTVDKEPYTKINTEDYQGGAYTYDTVRDIISDFDTTNAATYTELVPGGVPLDINGDGVIDPEAKAMEINAKKKGKILGPGLNWYGIANNQGSQNAKRPIRLVSIMKIDAGDNKTVVAGQLYNHRSDVKLTMMNKLIDNRVVGIDNNKIWATGLQGQYPIKTGNSRFWEVYTSNLHTDFDASVGARLYTEIGRVAKDIDGSFKKDTAGNYVIDANARVFGEGTGDLSNPNLDELKWNGRQSLYSDNSANSKYIISYNWQLKDGRYRQDTKEIDVIPTKYEITMKVLNSEGNTPNAKSISMDVNSDNGEDADYLVDAVPEAEKKLGKNSFGTNATAAWNKILDKYYYDKMKLEFSREEEQESGGTQKIKYGEVTIPGSSVKENTKITVPIKYYYPETKNHNLNMDTETTKESMLDVEYIIKKDISGNLYLRFNKILNFPNDFYDPSANDIGDNTGIGMSNGQEIPSDLYINNLDFDVDITFWLRNQVELNVRQVVIDSDKQLVIPSSGYVELLNTKTINDITNQRAWNTSILSSEVDKSPILETLYTKLALEHVEDSNFIHIRPVIPEYYEYIGHIQTTDKTQLSIEHVSSKLEVNSKEVEPWLNYESQPIYWVTVYITPKFAENEDSPRPYSWSFRTNQFGELKK